MPRPNNDVDLAIHMLIQELNIKIPILHIKNKLYLIGTNRITAEIKRDIVMLRVGGGYEKFVEYVPRNQRYFQRALVVYMIKSGESLEWVIDALYNGRKIKNIVKESKDTAARTSRSRSRSKSRQDEEADRTENLKRRISVNLNTSMNDGQKDVSPIRERGFSFRETSPYSKKKTEKESPKLVKIPS